MSQNTKLPQIVLFGDSLTQWSFDETTAGFGWVLEEKYRGKAEIVNEGVAGYTSTLLKPNFARIIHRATASSAPSTLLLTIFLGANDACLLPKRGEYVPLTEFESNIREFVETVLIQDNMSETKIVLITPPPINIPDPTLPEENTKKGRGYRTYMSKKRYAEKIMQIAADYEETGRVVGLDLWNALIDAALDDQGRSGDEGRYDEERLPGCGLSGAKAFRGGYFTDGLHFGPLAYDVLSKQLLEVTLTKWPELAPERIGE